ncbi:type II toxin-antitoxin system RelE/ParE family toxin [Dyella sp. LX-66]|uniref:type II toxin-antitoxin system RelE/ParE family toxin n=1 Tax=unclassified Dyella TaxID=2634549 RepID=UPI001BDFD0ED|nr:MULTISPECIES: type II toxin-antitoxin system RelE/ParE family toxin [unclassified Dyella]MBT2117799.1 type II toxin-antitoxin system RelE/ParE family toxin [Dyella sp. LX-1]MBT2141314.1 type II toxin-antitoxin system RelE/ParE family toxin [Dyella sp. LX-66]
MIQSTKGKSAAELIAGRCPKALQGIRKVAERKLGFLDAAKGLNDLRSPPGNKLELLKGNRENQYSIRINDQYRICFRWQDGNAFDVEVVDYH